MARRDTEIEPGLELVLDSHAILGEGPSWDDATGRLLWVDIVRQEIHRFDPRTGRDEGVRVDQPVGAAVVRVDGGYVAAARNGFALVDPDTGRLELIAAIEADVPGNRMNDGKCDSAGRFWAGTQALDLTPHAGGLYRLGADRHAVQVVDDVTISNGLGWSPDDRTMYYIDTAANRLDAFDFDAVSGAVSNRRCLAPLPPEEGGGDGLAVDTDGYVWVALWNGWTLRRYSPGGHLDRVVRFPVSHVTSCCFGGPDLDELYVTTASMTEHGPFSAEELRRQPAAGALFRLRPGVRGLATHPYRG
jgi:sugar lactone lactonase YvrE